MEVRRGGERLYQRRSTIRIRFSCLLNYVNLTYQGLHLQLSVKRGDRWSPTDDFTSSRTSERKIIAQVFVIPVSVK